VTRFKQGGRADLDTFGVWISFYLFKVKPQQLPLLPDRPAASTFSS
jgi:hypothetical protein